MNILSEHSNMGRHGLDVGVGTDNAVSALAFLRADLSSDVT